MAKNRSPLLKLQGTLGGVNFVKSGAYGDYTRAARGTYKEAHLNDVLQENANKSTTVTAVARPLLHLLKQMANGFAQRDLWQMMMKRMLKVKNVSVRPLLDSLEGLDMNAAYPLEKLVGNDCFIKTEQKADEAVVYLVHKEFPFFDVKMRIDSCCYTLYVIWLDEDVRQCTYASKESEWLRKDDVGKELMFQFDVPNWSRHWMMVMKIRGGKDGVEVDSFSGMGMRVVGVSKFP